MSFDFFRFFWSPTVPEVIFPYSPIGPEGLGVTGKFEILKFCLAHRSVEKGCNPGEKSSAETVFESLANEALPR